METHNLTMDTRRAQGALITLESFASLFRRRWRMAVQIGGGGFCLSMLLCLFLLPQSFTSNISLSILQPTDMAGGLLASATGLGASPTSKYVGVLKSQRFAESVEDRFHLQALYGLRERDDALDMLTNGLSVTDNPKDGLLYVALTLRTPALLSPGAGAKRERIRSVVAQAANLYADLLRDYMATSDVDRDAILLRGADEQIKQVRADYNTAVAHLADLIRTRGKDMGEALMSVQSTSNADSGSSTEGSMTSAKSIQSLYMVRAELEADIQTTEAMLQHENRLLNAQLTNPTALPTEDPLLMEARAEVVSANNEYEGLKLQYGPDHPRAVTAHDHLVLAQKTLGEQLAAIKEGRTTPQIEAQVKLGGLKTRYAAIVGQTEKAEAKANIGRDLMTEFATRRNEVLLRLEVLKAASSQSAMLSMQSIAATKKLAVVDTARLPRQASPGLALQSLLGLMLTACCLAVWSFVALRREASAVGAQILAPSGWSEAEQRTGNAVAVVATHPDASQSSSQEDEQRAA